MSQHFYLLLTPKESIESSTLSGNILHAPKYHHEKFGALFQSVTIRVARYLEWLVAKYFTFDGQIWPAKQIYKKATFWLILWSNSVIKIGIVCYKSSHLLSIQFSAIFNCVSCFVICNFEVISTNF